MEHPERGPAPLPAASLGVFRAGGAENEGVAGAEVPARKGLRGGCRKVGRGGGCSSGGRCGAALAGGSAAGPGGCGGHGG